MQEATTYSVKRANGTADLTVNDGRFIVNTKGIGLLDKLKTIDVPLKDVEKFTVVRTIGAQNVVGGTPGDRMYDESYDAEFIFSYLEDAKVKKKRVFVNSEDAAFQRVVGELERNCPGANLLDLDPAEAEKQIGVLSAKQGLGIVVAVIVGIPLAIGAIVVLVRALSH